MDEIIRKNHFDLLHTRPVEDVGGTLWEMEHKKTGTKLVWLERPDENMTFTICFKTIPEDSTGVFHILEHSVLCGSEKYPCKEPFVELMKSSLQTFLNAMTFPDKTLYPVSSRNRQDYLNLISVYMDAVFHPAIYHMPEIFRQEGWRYEVTDTAEPIYQGVVFNEMKGAYSSVDSVLEREMNRLLFPNTCYCHDSGGDPKHIPELTYEQFIASHRKYYHPSNALIVLDGRVDLGEILTLLDSYLSQYDRQDRDFAIPVQPVLPYREVESSYEIGADEDTTARTIVSCGRLLCTYDDQETIYAAQVLANYLAGDSEAPLKRAVLSAGLGQDVRVQLHEGIQQAWLGWEVWNTDREKLPELKALVKRTLIDQADAGLDYGRLAACIDNLAFSLLDRDSGGYPRGLMETVNILESWLYGGDPAQNLSFRQIVEGLRTKAQNSCFEELLRRTLLDDGTGILIVLNPNPNLGEEKRQQEQKRLNDAWAAMNDEARRQIRAEGEAIRLWQQTPDTAEAAASVPVLTLSDVPPEPIPLTVSVEQIGNNRLLCHKLDSRLTYLDLCFCASDLSVEDLPLAALLSSLLGKLATKVHDSTTLQNLVKQHIGSLQFSVETFPRGLDHCRVEFIARSVCLPERREQAARLLEEILTGTVFEDQALLLDTLRQIRTNTQMRLISWGNQYAIFRVSARRTAAGAANEHLNGVSFIRWIDRQCRASENDPNTLLAQLAALAKKLFTRERLTLSVSDNLGHPLMEAIPQAFPAVGIPPISEGAFPLLPPCREGIVIPADIAYAVRGANLTAYGMPFHGNILALSKLLSLEYLWNVIRVQGGAYGAGFFGNTSGDLNFYTYRDPNPTRSLDCFARSAEFLRSFCQSSGQLDKFILGAVSDTEPPLGTKEKIQLAESRYFKGISEQDICQLRRELLSTTAAELLNLSTTLEQVANSDNICVVGGKAQLDICGGILTAVEPVLT